LQRRRLIPLTADGRGLYVATAEDIVLRKLAWFRSGGEVSSSQWRDVLGVIAVSGADFDEEYLATWAGRLGVSDLLEKALAESCPPR
jgi:hypothetical protein